MDLKNKEALKEALEAYREGIKNNSLNIGDVENYKSLFFINENGKQRQIKHTDAINPKRAKEIESLSQESYFNYKGKREEDYARFSEVIVFTAALEHPELKKLMVNIAQDIIDYSLKQEDSENLWIDPYHVFGLDLLMALALAYPEYSYFIGLYITPYWDSEHAKYAFDYLDHLIKKNGFNKHTLKALASTYNLEQIRHVCVDRYNEGNYPLFDHFKNTPEDFEYFCNVYLEHVQQYPIKTEDEKGNHIVEIFFETILPEMTEEEMEEKIFINDTFENEILLLSSRVDKILANIPESELWFQERSMEGYDNEETLEDYAEVNKDFFINGFDNGEEIWEYIKEGKNPEILKTIPKANIGSLAIKRKLKILPRLEYYGTDIDDILPFFLDEYHSGESENRQFIIKINGKDISGKDICLRIIDIFFHLQGKKQFDSYTTELLTEEYELCSIEDLMKRYPGPQDDEKLIDQISSLMNPVFSDHMNLNELEKVYLLYKQKPEVWGDILKDIKKHRVKNIDRDILEVVPELRQTEYAAGSQLLIIAYICYKENMASPDQNLQVLINFYANNFWGTLLHIIQHYAMNEVKEGKKKFASMLSCIKDYCIGPKSTPPPKEIIIKLMKGGPSALNEEELKIFEQAKKQSQPKPLEEIAKELEKIFYYEDWEKEKGIPSISLFTSKHIGMLLASAAYGYRGMPRQLQDGLKKIFNLIVGLAPVKSLHLIYKCFTPTPYSRDIEIEPFINYLDILEKIGIPLSYVKAWEVVYLQKALYYEKPEIIKRYEALTENYAHKDKIDEDQPAIWVRQEKEEKKALVEVPKFLDKENRIKFLGNVNKKQPCEEFLKERDRQFQENLSEFCRIAIKSEPTWAMSDKEKESFKKKVQELKEHINNYLFTDYDFSDIEEKVLPLLDSYIPDSIDSNIWYFDETVRHKFLYMMGRFGHMNRIYDYWSRWEDAEREDITPQLYQLLISVGLGEAYALEFILKNHQGIHKNVDFEDNKFAQHYHNIYKTIDLPKIMETLPINLVVFGIRDIKDDLSATGLLLEFFDHPKKKVREQVSLVLSHRLEERIKEESKVFEEYATKAKGKAKNAYKTFITNSNKEKQLEQYSEIFKNWESLLN